MKLQEITYLDDEHFITPEVCVAKVYYPEFLGDNHYDSQPVKLFMTVSGDLTLSSHRCKDFVSDFNNSKLWTCRHCGKRYRYDSESKTLEHIQNYHGLCPESEETILCKLRDAAKNLNYLCYEKTGLTPYIASVSTKGSRDIGPE